MASLRELGSNFASEIDHRRIAFFMSLISHLVTPSISLENLHSIESVSHNKPMIWAVSHTSDVDMLIAFSALASERKKLNIATYATNIRDIAQAPWFLLMGLDNFHPISRSEKRTGNPALNPNEWFEMAKKMTSGYDMMIAAHKPSQGGILPLRAGIGSVILAQLTGLPIVPVSVVLSSQENLANKSILKALAALGNIIMLDLPSSQVIIGEPIILSERLSALQIKDFLVNIASGSQNPDTDYALTLIRTQAELVMLDLQKHLPRKMHPNQSLDI